MLGKNSVLEKFNKYNWEYVSIYNISIVFHKVHRGTNEEREWQGNERSGTGDEQWIRGERGRGAYHCIVYKGHSNNLYVPLGYSPNDSIEY